MKHRKPQKGRNQTRVFKTPERECPHADRGCCPRCLDPMSTSPTPFRRVTFGRPRTTK